MPSKLPRGGGYVYYNPFGTVTAVYLKPDRRYIKDTPINFASLAADARNPALLKKAQKTFKKRKTATVQSVQTELTRKQINSVTSYEVNI
jgi:hypothetical protein|tara:strand:+ start:366 stop:635 length:270 start_codon:yes stop_codon:yes gene_type:complete